MRLLQVLLILIQLPMLSAFRHRLQTAYVLYMLRQNLERTNG